MKTKTETWVEDATPTPTTRGADPRNRLIGWRWSMAMTEQWRDGKLLLRWWTRVR
jgi:hypothetical protein